MAKAKTLDAAFSELEAAIQALESGELSLEQSFKTYSDGMKLVKYCNDTIDKVEKKIIEIRAEDGAENELS